jgi:hypothetical protein
MYDSLTFREFTVLQNLLYEGTERAFCVANHRRSDPTWFGRYQPTHSEIAKLFIEVATELLDRMDYEYCVQAA